ncbi:CLUMA_CG009396, isoform A [Clunio marinus]|uniref:CLUMA_CG009396, isoform A n=1 Tax=Clunio marinus TaxID=568069 RepID=A0A1J1I6R8_9DIPT|nr:CLUMA_CG009396, isoform A [Clunio marinus]
MDLAEQIDDFIPSVQSNHSDMDSLIMLIFIVIITSLFLVWLGRFLYQKYVARKAVPSSTAATPSTTTPGSPSVATSPLVAKSVALQSSKPSPFTGSVGSRGAGASSVAKSRSMSQQSLNNSGVRKRLTRRSPGPDIQPRRSRSIPPPAIVITMDVETTIVVQVKAFRQLSGKADVLHYRVTIRFKGHLSVTMNYMTLVGDMRIEGYPEVKINIAAIGPIKTTGKEETEMQDLISESLNLTIREALYPIDFSVHATCPRALKMEPDDFYNNRPMDFPNPFDYMERDHHQQQMQQPFERSARSGSFNQPIMSMTTANRRLLVKIVKGETLMQAKDPYVTVEMDEPPQKNQTGARQGTSPFWDEHFLFDLSPSSSEILFEVYDRPANPNEYPKFLGLGLVGIDELAVGPSSSQIITLQPRPYETDPVSGAINVEFVFIEGAQVPIGRRPYKLKEALKLDPNQMDQLMTSQSPQSSYEAPSHNINVPRHSPMLQQRHQQQQSPYMNGNDRHLNVNPNSISPRSTSPSRDDLNSLRPINNNSSQAHQQQQQLQQRHSGGLSVTNSSKQYPYDNSSSNVSPSLSARGAVTSTPLKPLNSLNVKISMIQQEKESSAEPLTGNIMERGREKKKTTIFGTLKKRLSRSKTRNGDTTTNGTSNGNGYNNDHSNELNNGMDSPRDTLSQLRSSTLKSPTGGTLTRLGISGSRRSSLSEMSGVSRMSSISNKTFVHEASSLVLEVIENGVKRHYLVPINIAQKPRWRRKGTKLHIYNDHTFIAKHLPSGLICEICMQSIPYRMGKQGYECRDCLMKCHKQCHVRTPQICPKPTIQSIELCKISDADTAIRKL